jgi:hypothetical protein
MTVESMGASSLVKAVVRFFIFFACWLYFKYFDSPRYEVKNATK